MFVAIRDVAKKQFQPLGTGYEPFLFRPRCIFSNAMGARSM